MTETVIEEYTAEEVAWHAALDAAPEDDGLRLVFSDWLRDQGKDELADGFAALGRLPVRVDMGYYNGLNAHFVSRDNYESSTIKARLEGRLMHVSEPWYDLMIGELAAVGIKSLPRVTYIPRWKIEEFAALAYSKMTADQKDNAERLLKLGDR